MIERIGDVPPPLSTPASSPESTVNGPIQLQVSSTPDPWGQQASARGWPESSGAAAHSSSAVRTRRDASTSSASASASTADNATGSHAPTLSAQAQKLQQLPAEQQQQLIQQNESIKTRQSNLQADYPAFAKGAEPRAQSLVDQTYGPGHDASNLYLNEYEPPYFKGHPNPAAGRLLSSKPLAQVLRDNMPSQAILTNQYDASYKTYKIVSAEDRSKPFDEARAQLDPVKLYEKLKDVDYKSEHVNAIHQYYNRRGKELAQVTKDTALTQLEVQHATGELDTDDYNRLKTLMQSGKGGKIYTLTTGSENLAGGFRAELDSGKNFVYLSKERLPFQEQANAYDARKLIRSQGKDGKSAESFVSKHRSLLSDDGYQHGNTAVNELLERYGEEGKGLASMAFNGGKVDAIEYERLERGSEYEITQDPFGEMVHLSERNDVQDAKAAIQSNEDVTRDWAQRLGHAGVEIATSLPIGPELLFGTAGEAAKGVEGAAEGAVEAVEPNVASGEEAVIGGEGKTSGEGAAAGGNAAAGADLPGGPHDADGNLAALDELARSQQASKPALPPPAHVKAEELGPLNADGVYPGKDGNSYAHSNGDYFQVKKDKQLQGWVAVDPDRPNDFTRSVPVKLDGKGGISAFLPKARNEGGMDPVAGSSQSRPGPSQRRESKKQRQARNYTDAQGNHPFVRDDGTLNMAAYRRHMKEQSARNYTDPQGNHPFVREDDTLDMAAYSRHLNEQTARNYTDAQGNHRFVRKDGTVDMAAYRQYSTEQAARHYTDSQGNHPFVRKDDTVDMAAYHRHMREQSARHYTDSQGNHRFVRKDGTVDMAAYNRHMEEQTARHYTDSQGNHPFVRKDDTVDMAAYRRYSREQAARHYTDSQGNHPFVRRDDTVDMAAYNRHVRERSARHYTDSQGNHPFVREDGTVDQRGYEDFIRREFGFDFPLTETEQEAIDGFDDDIWDREADFPLTQAEQEAIDGFDNDIWDQ